MKPYFLYQNCYLSIPRPLKRTMKFLNFLSILADQFCPPGFGSGSTDLIESGPGSEIRHQNPTIDIRQAYTLYCKGQSVSWANSCFSVTNRPLGNLMKERGILPQISFFLVSAISGFLSCLCHHLWEISLE